MKNTADNIQQIREMLSADSPKLLISSAFNNGEDIVLDLIKPFEEGEHTISINVDDFTLYTGIYLPRNNVSSRADFALISKYIDEDHPFDIVEPRIPLFKKVVNYLRDLYSRK